MENINKEPEDAILIASSDFVCSQSFELCKARNQEGSQGEQKEVFIKVSKSGPISSSTRVTHKNPISLVNEACGWLSFSHSQSGW